MNGDTGGWSETIHQGSNRPYYYRGSETSWTKPDELLTPAQRATGWAQTSAPDGRPYWYSKEDKQKTSWTAPPGWNDDARPRDPYPPASSALTLARDNYRDAPRDRDDYRRDRPYDQGGYRGPIANSNTGFENASQPEKEAAFNKLLKRVGVQQNWTWEQAIKAAVQDPAFRAISGPAERRELFETYQGDLKRQEVEREQERLAKLKNDFRAMLQRHPEVQHYSTWKNIRPVVENEAVFRSTSKEAERESIFNEHIADLKDKHHEKRGKDHAEAVRDLGGLMSEVNIGADTLWYDAEKTLQESDSYKEDKYDTLTRLEILDKYTEHVRRLWKEINDIRQASKKLEYRQARKARDAFQDLLQELHSKDIIQARTTWNDAFAHISEDPRYEALLSNARTGSHRDDGSTPLDLFLDYTDELEHDLRKLTLRAEDALKASRIKLRPDLSLSDLDVAARSDRDLAHLPEATFKAIHARLLTNINASLDKSAADDRRRKRRDDIDALRSRIKHLDPPVLAEDTWDTIRPRVERTEEFAALPDDTDRRAAFEKHQRSLADDERRRRERRRRSSSLLPPAPRERDAYADDRRRAIEQRERQYRQGSGGPRDRPVGASLDDPTPGPRRGRYDPPPPASVSRGGSYVSRADPYSRGADLLDYGDGPAEREEARPKRPGSVDDKVRKRVKMEDSGSEEGEIDEA